MKKIITVILTGIVALLSFTLYGCDTKNPAYKKIMAKDETDGQFYYYYDKNLEGYAIVGDMEENNPEVMYLPGYYKGEEVKQIFYTTAVGGFGMQTKTFGPSFKGVKKVYMPFSVVYRGNSDGPTIYIEEIVYSTPYQKNSMLDYFIHSANRVDCIVFFLANKFFNTIEDMWKEHYNSYDLEQSIDQAVFKKGKKTHVFVRSNTTFLFNYSNSPNGDIFFIENYEYGNKIEPTPYLPLREGYMFTGWYKEADCKTKWNFETDTLPIVEYDKDGSPTKFVETKLYAGWQKI